MYRVRIFAILGLTMLPCSGLLAQTALGAAATLPAKVFHYEDYAPYGKSVKGQFKFGQWATKPVDANTTMVFWGDPAKWEHADVEEHAIIIHPKDGRRWVWIRAYIDQKVQRRYAISTTRAELIIDGKVQDVTPPSGLEGQPYGLADFTGPYTVRAWGTVSQDPKVCASNLGKLPPDAKEDGCVAAKRRKWFWQHTITPIAAVLNSCWVTNQRQTRSALLQEEVWWDSSGGWSRGTGQLDGNGMPDGTELRYAGMQTIAEGVGFAWTGANGSCLKAAWDEADAARPVPLN